MIANSLIILAAAPMATGQTFAGLPAGGGSLGGLLFFLFLIALVIVRRIRYAVRGRRYSTGRVISYPVIYLILTIVTVVPIEIFNPIALTSLLAILIGFPVGYVFGRNTSFFNQNGALYFKRSPYILIIWLISYIGRLFILMEVGANFEIAFIVDTILALTTGILLGEGIRVIRVYNSHHAGSPGDQGKAEDDEHQLGLMKEM